MADLSELKARIAAGEYRLDADAIAEAMFGAADRAIAAEGRSECSKPARSTARPAASTSSSPLPSRTSPIQVGDHRRLHGVRALGRAGEQQLVVVAAGRGQLGRVAG